MKTIRRFGLVLMLNGWLAVAYGQVSGPPTVLSQPADQTADYGGNAGFTVAVDGTALRYQWTKDGENLADYRNVAGANSATLHLVGVAQIDAGDYRVVISSPAGAVTSAVARLSVRSTTIFSDDFESGSLGQWTPFATNGALTISTTENRTPGGSRSALLTSSQGKLYRNLGTKLAGRAKATFWIYDDGGSQHRAYGELRGYTGPGHGRYAPPGGMRQLFAIGRYTVQFGTNHTGSLAGETVNTNKYQGKVERGKNVGWFNLEDGPDRSVGWHRFEIEREADGATVRFYVDGVLGRTITEADHVLLDCVTIGSIGGGTGVGEAWFDDVKVEAFPWRFDWQSKDTVGKGLFDWMQLRETGTDPVVTDVRQITTASEQRGVAAGNKAGRWESDGDGIYALNERDYVEYALNAPADDAYRIEVEGRERRGKSPTVKLPLIISLDGEHLGRFILPYSGHSNGFVHCFTPFLAAGPHTVRVYWDNVESRCSLYLQAVRLQSLSGPDLNSNRINDWAENRVLAQSGVESAPETSATSPVCVEGRGQYLSRMALLAGTDGPLSPIPVHPGAGHRWYADVPLSPGRATRIEILHQNGVLKETREIVWRVTNLLEAPDLTVRRGDALLLTAVPAGLSNGTVTVTVTGVTNYTTDVATPVAHRFDQAGVFTVTGTFVVSGRLSPASTSRSITVKVVEAALDGPVAAWAAKRRYWNCTNLPAGVLLEADPRLRLAEYPAPRSLGVNARQISLTSDAAEVRHVVARLGKNGPILARAAVEGFRLFNCYDTYLRLLQTYPDGSQLIEEAFILSPVLPNVRVEVRIIVSGVTFEDGTLTKTLTAGDFDELGICRVRYVRAPGVTTSVCHTTKAYQGDQLIGWPAYEK